MATLDGMEVMGNYAQVDYSVVSTAPTDVTVEIAKLQALIPDPDSVPSSAPNAGSILDMTPPAVCGQLRAEIAALLTALGTSA